MAGDCRGMSVCVGLLHEAVGLRVVWGVPECVNGSDRLWHIVGAQTVPLSLSIQPPHSAWL